MHFSNASRRVVLAALLTYLLIILTCVPFTSSARAWSLASRMPQQPSPQYREGELLVRFRAGVSPHEQETIVASHGAQKKKDLRGDSGIEKLEILSGRDVRTVALELLLNPQVEFAEPNFLTAKDDVIPNDARFNEQWSLRNTGQNSGQLGSDINAVGAWNTTTGSASTVIAVIDSGVDFSHPDLVNNQWLNRIPSTEGDLHGWDFVANSPTIQDEQGHGTAVAGIIAAEGNNSLGVTGVMWRASLMSLRVLDNTGMGDVANAVEAIDYAVAHGAQVINLSWGTTGESLALKQAIERALQRDVVVVCSAGNNGQDLDTSPYYPASFGLKDLITVAATDNLDQPAIWSNWGARKVTVASPGTNILTTQRGGAYWNVTGTSAAAPLVTGIAGLLKTSHPAANAPLVAKAISDGARKVESLSGKVASGGVASAAGALAKLHGPTNQPPVFVPPGIGSGGNGPGGSFSTTPPPTLSGAPAANLPNLDQLRNAPQQQAKVTAAIEPSLPCADCDPLGGGGGGSNYPTGDPNFSTARSRPVNETGQPDVDLGSQNFNWSLPLVSLPGRAGTDLNLTLSYNSLVWTRDGSYMKFNADFGTPAPGFRLGLPTLQQRFLNSQTGIYAYMLVTSSGGHVELRQVGTSTLYESQDSSYTQLDASNQNLMVLRTTDGTQFTFIPVSVNGEFRCIQIKDRNGNYISATYDTTNGHLLTITDTLGRVVSFVYYADGNLQALRQTWAGGSHDWATFYYTQVYVAPNFGGGLLVSGANNNYTTVLTKVTLLDGSYFGFDYNDAFAQVAQIKDYAPDNILRNYIYYNLNTASGQTECPRVTARRDWAKQWNGDIDGTPATSEEATTTYSVAADASWSQQTTPDGTIYKEFFATSGWQSGLTTISEIWSGGVKKKWTTLAWTQDNTGLSYQKNPRVTETNIYDAEGNRRRSTITYNTFSLPSGASCSLPSDVYEYEASATMVLRRTHTDYRYDAAYLNRRIIGLPSLQTVYDGSSVLASKIWYDYDWPPSTELLVATPQNAVQHDASYDINFVAGRGNLVLVLRYDLTDLDNTLGRGTEVKYGYNTNGSRALIRDHLWHQTNFGYQDSFSDSSKNGNTFAYPTTVTDPDNFLSTVQYNFDFGAVTRTQGPPPAGQSEGLIQTFTYDSVARLERATIANTGVGAYTRYVYGPNYVQSFSSVNNVGDDAYSCQIFDGAGRVIAQSSNHPGSTGGYIGQLTTYDVMGRATQQTKPTEITGTWAPAGDDAAWVYTAQAYDWKARPTLTTLPDSSTRENTYGGCGCAGGEVTTVRDERGRRRKLTMDVLGRLKQVDELNWDQSVYATTTYSYNVRDQLTQINQTGQIRSFTYDGHGRLLTRTTPEQGATSYRYLANDLVQTITDARGATTTFSYNNRNLVTGISYGVPAGVAATPNVTFGYDPAGNRTSMADGLGSVSYVYDRLSRLTSETRTFTGVGSYALSYTYNLANELTSITNPWGVQVGYNYDAIGRSTSVSGANYAGVSSYVNSLSYRAFGLKQMSYSNGRTLSLQYDSRMRVTQWNIPNVMGWHYDYSYFGENTGRVTYAQNLNDSTLDRSFHHDAFGRLQSSFTGSAARAHVGIGSSWASDGPYAMHDNVYDVWGNITSRTGWGGANPQYTATFTNNKMNGWVYDQAGNLTDAGGGWTFTYDATGQQATSAVGSMLNSYDGEGLRGRKTEYNVTTYYLRSSVLGGQVVAEMDVNGNWMRGYVYLGGELLAVQQAVSVNWVHQDPFVKSKRVTNSAGAVVSVVELDPWGGETNRSSNEAFQPKKFTSYVRDAIASDDAMHRRYNRWWSRFEQPDPHDGSYDLTNPQSFNRYSYVQNDPVNLVDLTGLDPDDPSPTTHIDPATGQLTPVPGINAGTVFIDGSSSSSSSGIMRSGNGIFDGDMHLSLTSIYFLKGGPQNAAPQDNRTACEHMADDAQHIADETRADYPRATAAWVLQEFNRRYGQVTFGSYFSETPFGFLGTPSSGRNVLSNRSYKGDSGFPEQFRDTLKPGEDQVHHFGAFFSAGLAGHKLIPDQHRANDRGAGNTGDVKLGDQSRRLGDYLRRNPGQLSNVGKLIKDVICGAGAIPK
jgi:RHS repeat-associated protein